MRRLPVHLVTGFLGSGKTTFLNYLIKQQQPERILVIENECGATNIDGGLLLDEVESVVELSAGCLCCSLADGLLNILEATSKKVDQYDRMMIETTGIADPASIIQVFLTNPAVEQFFELQQVICLADAGLVEEWLEEAEEALRQVALADVILINKIDTVTSAASDQVKKVLKGINPHAEVFTGQEGIFPLHEVLSIGTVRPESVESIALREHHHKHDVSTNNSHQITTFTLSFPNPVDLDELHAVFSQMVRMHRHQVYRIKGFIAIPDYPNRVILQSTCSTIVVTDGTPWKAGENREGKLVFIGRNLKRETFEHLLTKYLNTEPVG